MGLKLIVLIIAILLTGLSAGLCFTWTNTITTGIGKLENLGYLQAFQQMNRSIINPTFIVVFFGPIILQIISIFLWKDIPKTIMIHFITATLVYLFGLVLVTIFGNVPLNEILDKTNLATAKTQDLQRLRNLFEIRWNQLHLIRTISSFIAFLLLVIALVKVTQH
ncbi:MAG: DUF1772 domain-containing protein, partial [Kordia sp.]|uniref:anthrone oxygenase family protein n=1 Tax=Kordia sp. TaxID=1965332 RepID=UPI00385B10E7